ncbi:MAG: FimV/HubP family polar landmark protein, partial [Chromatiaceae bacterium]
MVRKLALAVSIALGTLNVPAHALGLGELASKSRLNQNFNGDITLLSVSNEELDGIRVKLADAEAFQRAGAERPFYLSLLKFSPQLNEAGKPVIRVSSEFPIREPFLNFLVEVNWPNGRMLREYTVLLDPPTTTMRRPPQTAAPVAQTRPAPPPVAAPVRAAPAPTSRAASAPVVRATAGEYGPVQASETAWSIAKKVRPSGVSMEQMMMALLSANPEAFVDNNINRLRQGRILRVPALDEIQQLTRQQARAMYREQQDQWLARRDARLQAAAAAEAPPTDATPAAETDDQLRIAAPRPDGEGDAGAGENDATAQTSDDLQSRLIVARENAETSRQEAEVLRSQVDDLQARLEDMQKLLSLKDDQLARLQDRLVTDEAAEAAAPAAADAAAEEPVVETQAEAVVSDTAVPSFVPPPGYQIPDVTPLVDVDAIVEGRLPPEDALDEVLADLETAAQDTVEEAVETTEVPVSSAPAVPNFAPPPGYQIPDVTPRVDVDAIVEGRVPVEVEPVDVEPVEVTGAVEEPGEIVIEGLADIAAEPVLDQPAA